MKASLDLIDIQAINEGNSMNKIRSMSPSGPVGRRHTGNGFQVRCYNKAYREREMKRYYDRIANG